MVYRNCARCGLELTDAASREAGIGPICRKLDNAVLARLIPSNVPLAVARLSRVTVSGLPEECAHTLNEVVAALTGENAASVLDWRVTVKRIEWLLSWGLGHETRHALMEIVRALGYVGLAALWNGEAATGKATVTFVGGRLHVAGPRNKSARISLKKIGAKFHSEDKVNGIKATWSVPAASHAAFYTVIVTHYPNFVGLAEAVEAAKAAKVTATVEAKSAEAAVVPVIEEVGSKIAVRTPYNAGFVAAIKALPFKARGWDPVSKCWRVEKSLEPKVIEMVKSFYHVEPKIVAEVTVA